MTGAVPNTGWLDGCVAMDAKGFIKTGLDLSPDDLAAAHWPLTRYYSSDTLLSRTSPRRLSTPLAFQSFLDHGRLVMDSVAGPEHQSQSTPACS